MNRDTVIGIVGAITLMLVMGGVFAYEYATFDQGAFERQEESLTETGTLAENEMTQYTFDVDGDALAEVGIRLSWTDDVGDPDTFRVTVLDADGEEAAQWTADNGSITGSITFNDPPEGAAMPDAWEGTQTWTVQVALESAPGTAGAVAPLNEADGSQDFTLEWTEVRYRPSQ